MRRRPALRWAGAARFSLERYRALRRPGRCAFGRDAMRSASRGASGALGLLADTMAAWQRLAALADQPDLVIPHGHVTAWTSPQGADNGLRAAARRRGDRRATAGSRRAILETLFKVMTTPPVGAS